MGYVEITQEQLAEVAGAVFRDRPVEDVPDKLWLDYWPGGEQHYLRAIFDQSASGDVLELLQQVASRLRRLYDVQVVCVAYVGEYSWEEVEGWVSRLMRVE